MESHKKNFVLCIVIISFSDFSGDVDGCTYQDKESALPFRCLGVCVCGLREGAQK